MEECSCPAVNSAVKNFVLADHLNEIEALFPVESRAVFRQTGHVTRFRHVFLLSLLLACLNRPAQAGEFRMEGEKPVIDLVIHNWIYPDPYSTSPTARANHAIIRAFVKAYPGIVAERYADDYAKRGLQADWSRVEIRPRKFTGIKVEGVESDLLAIAGGMAPDVFYVNFRKSATYVDAGFLAPLDDRLADMNPNEFDQRVHEKILPVIRRPGPSRETRTWMLPYGGLLGKVMFYRKDRFDQAGIPYPTADWTWDDLHDICKKLSRPSEGQYAIRLGRGKHESYFWTTFLWSAGADVMLQDDVGKWEIVYDSPEAAVALDFYTTLVTEAWIDETGTPQKGYAYRDSSGAYVKWKRGEIAMMQGYIDEDSLNVVNPELTGMVPVPLGPSGIRGAEINGRMMGLSSSIQDPVVADAAWEFIRFFDSDAANAIRTRILVESGFGAFVHPDYLRKFGYDALLSSAGSRWTQVFELALENGKPEPYGPHSNNVYDRLTVPLQEAQELALDGELPADEAARLRVLQDLLRVSAEIAREEMLGVVSTEERKKRNVLAALLLIVLVVGYSWLISRLWRVYGANPPVTAGVMSVKRKGLWLTLLLAPAVISTLVWQYLPLARGSIMAFQDVQLQGGSAWVGLKNFGDMLVDSTWWHSVRLAVQYTCWVMALTFIPPLLLAILLQETPWGSLFFRVVYYLPAVVNGLVVILMWKSFYDETQSGLLNSIVMNIPAWVHIGVGGVLCLSLWSVAVRCSVHGYLWRGIVFVLMGAACAYTAWTLAAPVIVVDGGVHIQRLLESYDEPIRWLSDPDTAMFACVLPLAWASVGPGCLVYLAALKGIPDDLYEAADLDGAGFVDKVLHIVIPTLKPLLIINAVGVFVAAFFHAEANILAMTGGGADTTVAGLHIFYRAFIFLEFGPATAMAWMLGVLLIGFTIYQLRMLANLEFKTTGAGAAGDDS